MLHELLLGGSFPQPRLTEPFHFAAVRPQTRGDLLRPRCRGTGTLLVLYCPEKRCCFGSEIDPFLKDGIGPAVPTTAGQKKHTGHHPKSNHRSSLAVRRAAHRQYLVQL